MNYTPVSDDLIRSIHADFVEDMILFYENDQTVEENEGVSETFRQLKAAGIKVFVDTGFDRPIVDALLHRMAWEKSKLIDASMTSDEVAHGRPSHPDLIFRAMELAGVSDVKRVAKVGDTVSDFGEGNAAGCGLVIGITTGAFPREHLLTVPHTHLMSQIPEVLLIINSQASVV